MNTLGVDPFACGVPSAKVELLRSLIGSTLTSMTRYSPIPLEKDLLKYEPWERDMEFSLASGVVLFSLDDGRVIGANSEMSKISVLVWLEKDKEGRTRGNHVADYRECFPISALDEQYSSQRMRDALGKRIQLIRIFQRHPHVEQARKRPREVGLQLELEDGSDLLLGHGLCDGGGFCVITSDQIEEIILPDLFEQQVIRSAL